MSMPPLPLIHNFPLLHDVQLRVGVLFQSCPRTANNKKSFFFVSSSTVIVTASFSGEILVCTHSWSISGNGSE